MASRPPSHKRRSRGNSQVLPCQTTGAMSALDMLEKDSPPAEEERALDL